MLDLACNSKGNEFGFSPAVKSEDAVLDRLDFGASGFSPSFLTAAAAVGKHMRNYGPNMNQ